MKRRSLCLLLSLPLFAFACKRAEPAPAPTPADKPSAQNEAQEKELSVFAAASLKEAFNALASDFKQMQPGVEVNFQFAGSQEIRTQIEHGAPADVFASADQKHMNELVKAGKAKEPVTFARNEPVVVVAEAQKRIQSLADLPNAVKIVIGAPEVPIGRYTLQILDKASDKLGKDFRARVEAHVVSRELNVRQVLAKVTLGEADAGIVYRTDVPKDQNELRIVAIAPELNVIAEYPIAALTAAPHPRLAKAWVELVTSERGQAALKQAGFLAPTEAVGQR